ncbi:nucleotide-diphospho-sugar transferase [Larkinella punicea]|uniref:Nucleotide-diphospho-sugar transferase n=1 Tax=Larkinella punicea TaxID=2315727 RepID=A0A368JTS1_9BACT|nr:nucleotide-diphospho-sugar transferase [Larkinella punicea]RCR70852.1 nucleotide-diphospho-sugar transferase [Larkinella punicea]
MFNNVDIPVLLLLFNRPHYAFEVISALEAVRPARIYVAVDGPRAGHPTDAENVEKCLALLARIDWPCRVEILKRERNLGCGLAVSEAISWFFEHEPMGIILEDDCVPTTAFFGFCAEMLLRYQDDERVMHITGTRWNEEYPIGESYFFTAIGHIWGWATWRRAWQHYDFQMSTWPSERHTDLIAQQFPSHRHVLYWETNFDTVYHQTEKHTWDYQWQYALFRNGGLSVTPQKNLIRNIGAEGVHDSESDEFRHRRTVHPEFQIKEESIPLSRHPFFDGYNMDHYFLRKDPLWVRLKRRVRKISEKLSVA